MLTDAQIDRYSRQIILPEVGGVGQERLLASRLTLMAEIRDMSPVLEYLAGAGVGTIHLDCAADDGGADALAAAIAELNPEVRIQAQATHPRGDQTLLVLAGTNRIIEAARALNKRAACQRVIFARLGEPYLMAILGGRGPCVGCADAALLGPIERGPLAAAVGMAAAAEAIKALLAVSPEPPRLIEFSGYESRSTRLEAQSRQGCPICK